jgi:transmembrane sensor
MNAANRSATSADEQAALWAARLDGSTLSADDRAALETWLASAPGNRRLLATYCQLSADLEADLQGLAGAGEQAEPIRPFRRRAALWLGLAAAAAALAFGAFRWQPAPSILSRQVATASAQRESLSLPDGSRIDLHAQTNLRVDLDARDRRVRLAAGEAYFEVARDPARPFTVETPAGSVRVTGTAFSVRASPGGALEVVVREGTVQVRAGPAAPAPFELGAGGRLRAAAGRHEVDTLSPGEVDAALAWREGQAVFADTPLAEALARFAHYHGRGLIADPDAAGLTLGGRHRLDDLDGFLASLEAVLPVRVTHGLDGIVHVGLRGPTRPAPASP